MAFKLHIMVSLKFLIPCSPTLDIIPKYSDFTREAGQDRWLRNPENPLLFWAFFWDCLCLLSLSDSPRTKEGAVSSSVSLEEAENITQTLGLPSRRATSPQMVVS